MESIKCDLYSVESLDNVLGNEHAISKLRNFARDINNGKACMPLLIYGPTGTGKSIAAYLLAKESGWNIVELNASDYRDKESIDSRLLSAATSRSLFGGRNLILLDEIDETVSRFDKGVGPAVNNLISKSKNPVILIANNMWDQNISFLRGKSDPVEFKKLGHETVQNILMRLAERFSMSFSKGVIEAVANRSNGDARSAINDLSALVGAEQSEDATEVIGMRDRKIDIFYALDRIFLTDTISASMRAVTSTDVTNDMLIKWIDENIPKRYTHSDDIYRAFDSLSLATAYAARAQRSQYYTYWRYMDVLMSSGVALSKKEMPGSRAPYSFPKVIKDLSNSKASRNQEREIAVKLQRVFHSNISKIVRGEMRILSRIVSNAISDSKLSKDEAFDELMSRYQLDNKEIEYMIKMVHN